MTVEASTPLQRLSEIVEAGTPAVEADGGLVPMALMTLVASAVRLARFLASPEAVEVLARALVRKIEFDQRDRRQAGGATDEQIDKMVETFWPEYAGQIVSLIDTIAEQVLEEPSHG